VKKAIMDDLETRYQDNEICELMNKASLLDPCLKSLIHLTEEQQINMIDCLVNEIISTTSPSATIPVGSEELELVVLDDTDERPLDGFHSSGDSGEPEMNAQKIIRNLLL